MLLTISRRAEMSVAVSTAPVGLCGELMMIIAVRDVIASLTLFQSIAKFGGSIGMRTALPPASLIAGS